MRRDLGVVGMTCEHCVAAVTEELMQLDGVRQVRVDLRPGSPSVVHIDAAHDIPEGTLAAAIDEAGYELAG